MSSFEVQVIHSEDVTIVRCAGDLVHESKADQLHQIVSAQTSKFVFLNFAAVERIDAHSIGVLVALARQAATNGQLLQVTFASQLLRDLIGKLGLQDLFFTYENVALTARSVAASRATNLNACA